MTATIEDVKYLRDKLFSALKIPQSYLTMGEVAQEDKQHLHRKTLDLQNNSKTTASCYR